MQSRGQRGAWDLCMSHIKDFGKGCEEVADDWRNRRLSATQLEKRLLKCINWLLEPVEWHWSWWGIDCMLRDRLLHYLLISGKEEDIGKACSFYLLRSGKEEDVGKACSA